MRHVEKLMGPIQLIKREENEIAAVADEIKAHIENNDDNKRECEMDGHDHPPRPMIKGSYDKYYY